MSITKLIPLALFVLICKQLTISELIKHCHIEHKGYCADITAKNTVIARVCIKKNYNNLNLDAYEPYHGRCKPSVLKISLFESDQIKPVSYNLKEEDLAKYNDSDWLKEEYKFNGKHDYDIYKTYELTILKDHQFNLKKKIDNILVHNEKTSLLNKFNKRISEVLNKNLLPSDLYIRNIYYLEPLTIKLSTLNIYNKTFDKTNYLRTILCLLEKICDDSILKENDSGNLLKRISKVNKLQEKGIYYDKLEIFIKSSDAIKDFAAIMVPGDKLLI